MNDLSGQHPVQSSWNNVDDRLDSWKEIAAYLERTPTTAKRWEKREGLPVHRHIHDKRGTVYAYRSEIETWLANRSRVLENDRPGRFPFSKSLKIAACVVILLLAALVAYDYQSDDLGFEDYSRSAYELVLNDGDLDRAKPYLDKALELLTPEEFEGNHDRAIALMWLPAFEALLHADPETALREASRSLERLRSFEGGRFVADSPTGELYLTLGKIERAREWFEETTEPGTRRQIFLAAIAYVEEDHEAMTEHLEQALKAAESLRHTQGSVRDPDRDRTPLLAPTAVLLLTRGGLQPIADEFNPNIDPGLPGFILERIEKRRGIRRGMLAVSQGNRIEGMRMLGDALLSISLTDSNSAATYFMGSEILAEAWREQGDSTNAVAVLRAALEKESFLLLDQSVLTGPLWLRLQAQLAQLYREMGRDEDARKIEDKLRRLLALADSDHPILRQLDRTQDLALREGLTQ